MRPNERTATPQSDLFRLKLVNLIDLRHELCRLAQELHWQAMADECGALYAEAGRPGVPIRLMVGLQYLKHTHGLSDEAVVKSWVENPYWQYFCGEEFFQHRLPIDPSQMTRFRTRLGAAGCEKLLALTIRAGLATQAVKPTSFANVTIDTTVQEKAIAFPTDGRLYYQGREWLVRPVACVTRMRESMAHLTPQFSTNRAVREYTEQHYLPAAARYLKRTADRCAVGKKIVDWQQGLQQKWQQVRFGAVKVTTRDNRHQFEVEIFLGNLQPDAVRAELYAEGMNGGEPALIALVRDPSSAAAIGRSLYRATVAAKRAAWDYTARLISHCDDASLPLEDGHILWQR